MKKIISLLLLSSLLVFAFVACDNSGANNDDKDAMPSVSFTTPATDTANFVYDGDKITGLTDTGKTQKTLTLPADAASLEADALKDSTALETLVIGERTSAINLANGCLNGTKNLNVCIGCKADKVTCGNSGLLTGATGLVIYIVSAEYSNFKNDYTWGNYSDKMKKYE